MLVLLEGTLVSWGQNYETIFGIDSTEWEIPFCNLDQGEVVHKIAIEDTLINSLNYKKVGTKYGSSIDYSLGLTIYPNNGFLREDTSIGNVWFLASTDAVSLSIDTIEYLVADFSLVVGDTFRVYNWGNGDTTIVVDSVYYQGGLKSV